MLYDKLNRDIEAVILRVDSSAAFERGVKWCDSNSTKNNSNISDSINDLESFDFSSILSVKQYWSNPLEKDRRQAEILVPSIVAPALITAWRSPERKAHGKPSTPDFRAQVSKLPILLKPIQNNSLKKPLPRTSTKCVKSTDALRWRSRFMIRSV